MNETNQKGLITETYCQLAFTELGIMLSKPISHDCRYDYIADIGGQLKRIQCKTSLLNEYGTSISFKTTSIRGNTKEVLEHTYTTDEIDYFYTYFNGTSYLVPVEICGETKKSLYLSDVTLQGSTKNITPARDYELSKMVQQMNGSIQTVQINNKTIHTTETHSYCIECGKEITKGAKRCKECAIKHQTKVELPAREALKNMIRTTSFEQLGRNFGVDGNTVRKWCDKLQLPRTKQEINSYSNEEWEKI